MKRIIVILAVLGLMAACTRIAEPDDSGFGGTGIQHTVGEVVS